MFKFQVAEEIWICDKQKITKWDGDIFTYKDDLKKQIERNQQSRKLTER